MILAVDDKVKTQWTIAAIMNTNSSLFAHWETLERVLLSSWWVPIHYLHIAEYLIVSSILMIAMHPYICWDLVQVAMEKATSFDVLPFWVHACEPAGRPHIYTRRRGANMWQHKNLQDQTDLTLFGELVVYPSYLLSHLLILNFTL